MKNAFGFSEEAVSFLEELGFELDPYRTDREYRDEIREVISKEDIRLAMKAAELEMQGILFGLNKEETEIVSLCTEIFNKLADYVPEQDQ